MGKKVPNPLIEMGRQVLYDSWNALQQEQATSFPVPEEIAAAIDRSINSNTLTYRYVLPTQGERIKTYLVAHRVT